MKNRPHATDEEIRSYMNFDSVVSKHRAQRKAAQTWLRNTALLLGAVGIGAVVYFTWPSPSTTPAPGSSSTEPQPQVADSIRIAKEITPPAIQLENKEEEKKAKAEEKEQPTKPEKKTEAQRTVEPAKEEPATPVFQYTEAEPAEGYPNLYAYFARELQYPVDALKDSIQGVVSVSFVITKEGTPSQIKIQNSLGPLFDAEAQRLIENMPAWKAATLNGKPTTAKISLPLTFQIVKVKADQK